MNSVVKMNSEHTTVYHHYGRSNQNLFLVEKPAPSFSFPSEPIPQFHRQEAKGIFPHESRKQGSHTEGQTAGSVWLMSSPEINFCALVKYRAQHDTSWAFPTTTC